MRKVLESPITSLTNETSRSSRDRLDASRRVDVVAGALGMLTRWLLRPSLPPPPRSSIGHTLELTPVSILLIVITRSQVAMATTCSLRPQIYVNRLDIVTNTMGRPMLEHVKTVRLTLAGQRQVLNRLSPKQRAACVTILTQRNKRASTTFAESVKEARQTRNENMSTDHDRFTRLDQVSCYATIRLHPSLADIFPSTTEKNQKP